MKKLLLLLLLLLPGCETTGISVSGPGYSVSYDKAKGVGIVVTPQK